ncbi:ComEC/Rec2 family competence protein [Pedobacter faecalis]|uniref:ComEC/Rec2 family competence protein n=1 Tax=Pedobacter faecalis TaxID=3041495 RepID=UPI00254E1901|nr:ComEC/Rec2 family competence protein [Pedobacter sp. ELA7]
MKHLKNNGLSDITLARITLPYVLGLCAFYALRHSSLLSLLVALSSILFICLCVANMLYARARMYRYKLIIGALLYLLLFLLGGICCLLHRQSDRPQHFSHLPRSGYLRIRVDTEPHDKPGSVAFTADVTAWGSDTLRSTLGRLQVYLRLDSPAALPKLRYGDELLIPAKYREPKAPQHEGQFDYRAWLAAKNVYHQAFLEESKVRLLARDKGNPVQAFAFKLRAQQVSYYRKVISKADHQALLSALILGYKAELDQHTLTMYAGTGIIHALSVSGMHVGMIYMVLTWLLRFMDGGRLLRTIRTMLMLLLIWGYAVLTGLSPSALRAAVMISVLILSRAASRPVNNYNVLAFTALVMLVADPFLVWDAGFQLSFLAVFGLMWLQPKFEGIYRPPNRVVAFFWSSTCMSIAAQLATFPLSIYYFHQFPVCFLVSNLFVLLPLTMIMYLGIALLLLRAGFLAGVLEYLIDLMHRGLNAIAGMPGSTISGIWVDRTELVLITLSGVLLVFAFSHGKKQLLIAALCCGLCTQLYHTMGLFSSLSQRKSIRFDLPQGKIMAFLSGRHAVLVALRQPDKEKFRYLIKPVLDKHRVAGEQWLFISK